MILLTSNQFQKDRIPFSTILKIRRDVISYYFSNNTHMTEVLPTLVFDTKEEAKAFLEYDNRKLTKDEIRSLKESVKVYKFYCKKNKNP